MGENIKIILLLFLLISVCHAVFRPLVHTTVSRNDTDAYLFLTEKPRLSNPEIEKFTICMWIKIDDEMYPLSEEKTTWDYDNTTLAVASAEDQNHFKILVMPTWSWLYISGDDWYEQSYSTQSFLNWAQYCLVKHQGSTFKIYIDGVLEHTVNIATSDFLIPAGSWWALGNDHDEYTGGGFESSQNWYGYISDLNVWDHAIVNLAALAGTGNILSLRDSGLQLDLMNIVSYPAQVGVTLRTVYGFPLSGDNILALMIGWPQSFQENLEEFTLQFWFKDMGLLDTPFIWVSNVKYSEALSIAVQNGTYQITINDESMVCDMAGKKWSRDKWIRATVTWSNSNGEFQTFLEDKLICSGSGLATGKTIEGGALTIGANQNKYVLGATHGFYGSVTGVNLWSKWITNTQLYLNMYCISQGSVMDWWNFNLEIEGNGIQTLEESLCDFPAVKGSSSDYVGTQKAKSRIFCTLKDFKLRGEGIDSVEHHGISINMCLLDCMYTYDGSCEGVQYITESRSCTVLLTNIQRKIHRIGSEVGTLLMSPWFCVEPTELQKI